MKTDFDRHQDCVLDDGALELACGGFDPFDGLREVAKTVKEVWDHLTHPLRKDS